jgi:hypothetical protein
MRKTPEAITESNPAGLEMLNAFLQAKVADESLIAKLGERFYGDQPSDPSDAEVAIGEWLSEISPNDIRMDSAGDAGLREDWAHELETHHFKRAERASITELENDRDQAMAHKRQLVRQHIGHMVLASPVIDSSDTTAYRGKTSSINSWIVSGTIAPGAEVRRSNELLVSPSKSSFWPSFFRRQPKQSGLYAIRLIEANNAPLVHLRIEP